MALPGTPGGGQQISMSQINTELGRASNATISLDTAENGTYAAINTCSQYYPLAANPATMNEWHGYNHTAVCLTSFTMYYYNTGDGYYGGTSATQACDATYTYTVYASTSTIGNGTRLYYNSNGTGEVEGSNNTSYYWFKIDGYSFSYTQGSGNGIANYTACSSPVVCYEWTIYNGSGTQVEATWTDCSTGNFAAEIIDAGNQILVCSRTEPTAAGGTVTGGTVTCT